MTPPKSHLRCLGWAGVLLLSGLAGCAVQPVAPPEPTLLEQVAPRSLLVVPVMNQSLDVDAPNYLLSALPVPLAEKGYYVFPVNTTRIVLEQEGYYEAEQVRQQPPEALAKLFGADAILYVTILRWDAKYVLLSTVVTVEFDYRIVGKDGQELWKSSQRLQYQPNNNNQNAGSPLANLIASAVTAALTRAAPNYMPLARQANARAFLTGPNPLPDGPYRPRVKP